MSLYVRKENTSIQFILHWMKFWVTIDWYKFAFGLATKYVTNGLKALELYVKFFWHNADLQVLLFLVVSKIVALKILHEVPFFALWKISVLGFTYEFKMRLYSLFGPSDDTATMTETYGLFIVRTAVFNCQIVINTQKISFERFDINSVIYTVCVYSTTRQFYPCTVSTYILPWEKQRKSLVGRRRWGARSNLAKL